MDVHPAGRGCRFCVHSCPPSRTAGAVFRLCPGRTKLSLWAQGAHFACRTFDDRSAIRMAFSRNLVPFWNAACMVCGAVEACRGAEAVRRVVCEDLPAAYTHAGMRLAVCLCPGMRG